MKKKRTIRINKKRTWKGLNTSNGREMEKLKLSKLMTRKKFTGNHILHYGDGLRLIIYKDDYVGWTDDRVIIRSINGDIRVETNIPCNMRPRIEPIYDTSGTKKRKLYNYDS